jgi:Xaa-Pro aminopeptidase
VSEYLRRKRGLRVAIAPSRITLAEWTLLKKGVGKGVRWLAVDGVVDQLRGLKDASEISQIREAARLGSEVMEETIRWIRPGVTEMELAAEIGYRMRPKGASGESFEAIVAAGASHAYLGHKDWEPLAHGFKTIEDALAIHRRLLLAFELAER